MTVTLKIAMENGAEPGSQVAKTAQGKTASQRGRLIGSADTFEDRASHPTWSAVLSALGLPQMGSEATQFNPDACIPIGGSQIENNRSLATSRHLGNRSSARGFAFADRPTTRMSAQDLFDSLSVPIVELPLGTNVVQPGPRDAKTAESPTLGELTASSPNKQNSLAQSEGTLKFDDARIPRKSVEGGFSVPRASSAAAFSDSQTKSGSTRADSTSVFNECTKHSLGIKDWNNQGIANKFEASLMPTRSQIQGAQSEKDGSRKQESTGTSPAPSASQIPGLAPETLDHSHFRELLSNAPEKALAVFLPNSGNHSTSAFSHAVSMPVVRPIQASFNHVAENSRHDVIMGQAGPHFDLLALDPQEATTKSINSVPGANPGPHNSERGSTQDLFAYLNVTDSARPTWVHADAHKAEVAYLDPSFGVVGVRAQADHTGIHATILPGSQVSAQMLEGHLAGIATYLNEHKTLVQTLEVAQMASSTNSRTIDQGSHGQSGRGYDDGRQLENGDEEQANVLGGKDAAARTVLRAASQVFLSPTMSFETKKQHISVIV